MQNIQIKYFPFYMSIFITVFLIANFYCSSNASSEFIPYVYGKPGHTQNSVANFVYPTSPLASSKNSEETVNTAEIIEPTPVPTARQVTDPYYKETSIYIMMQTKLWAENLGLEEAIQGTVQWLNGKMELTFQDGKTWIFPPPEGISGAVIDSSDPTIIWIEFSDGRSRCLSFIPIVITAETPPPVPSSPTVTPAPTVSSNNITNIFLPTYIPEDFRIVATDLRYENIIKNYYRPQEGYRFCIISIHQQNVSPETQIYTGTFTLFDKEGNSYEYLYELSNFHLQILLPGWTNFGYLVYEIPFDSIPDRLVLYRIDEPYMEVDLL